MRGRQLFITGFERVPLIRPTETREEEQVHGHGGHPDANTDTDADAQDAGVGGASFCRLPASSIIINDIINVF